MKRLARRIERPIAWIGAPVHTVESREGEIERERRGAFLRKIDLY